MSLSKWGPPIWTFFHVLSEKLKEDCFDSEKSNILNFIVQICKTLPCPTCSAHASDILRRLQFENIRNKQDLKNVVFLFHNIVNKNKNKTLFNYTDLDTQYAPYKLLDTYNNFISVYQTRGNLSLLSDSFQRTQIIGKLKTWIQTHINSFDIS